ncbi:competence/damage-inducible protein A [Sulfurimonas sp.]
MKNLDINFYAVIIGTEILNGRREDKHFTFLQNELAKYGHTLFASFIVKDDISLIENIYEMIQKDEKSVMFSFGGIGSTPDDLTRDIASKVFRKSKTQQHQQFFQDIIEKFKEEAYPYRVHMADLPPNADLIKNPINNMSGFSLNERFFFVPGFPSMAHPMLSNVIQEKFSNSRKKHRLTLLAKTSENTLIAIMNKVPTHIELSSLPIFKENKPNVELSLLGEDENELLEYFELFKNELDKKKIYYELR